MASSASEAKSLVQKQLGQVDLLITDISLRDTSGDEMAKDMFQDDESLRVLLVSGKFRSNSEGCDGYPPSFACMRKPFSQSELRAMVKKMLRGVTGRVSRP
jgi:DNA-binding response OmpR family regulator